jgi:hypothetical protein
MRRGKMRGYKVFLAVFLLTILTACSHPDVNEAKKEIEFLLKNHRNFQYRNIEHERVRHKMSIVHTDKHKNEPLSKVEEEVIVWGEVKWDDLEFTPFTYKRSFIRKSLTIKNYVDHIEIDGRYGRRKR